MLLQSRRGLFSDGRNYHTGGNCHSRNWVRSENTPVLRTQFLIVPNRPSYTHWPPHVPWRIQACL